MQYMKRISDKFHILFLLLILCLIPIGCGMISAETPTPAPTEMPTAIPTATPPPSAEAIVEEVFIETPAPTGTPTATPTETPAPTAEPEPTPFGLLWLPDTQNYTAGNIPEKLEKLDLFGTEIVSRIEPEHLIGVLHTGDMVDSGNRLQQWEQFGGFLDAFIDRVPFYPVTGNHDIGKYDSVSGGSYWAYMQQPFLDRLPEGQTYNGGRMFYAVLNGGEHPLLLLGIGYDMCREKEQREWVDEVMRTYADIPCMMITHAYEISPGVVFLHWNYLEKEVVSRYPNIKMVLCGHSRGFFHSIASYDDDGDGAEDRAVHVLMLNDQDGVFRYGILCVDMIRGSVRVRTFIPASEGSGENGTDPIDDLFIENVFS